MAYCMKCGAELKAEGTFCPSCGAPVSSPRPLIAPTPSRRSRPSGIIILTFLEGISSFFMLLGGAVLLVLSVFLASGGWDLIPEEELAEALQQVPWASTFTSVPIIALTTAFLTGIGLILLVLALLGFIMTWGLWSGRSWARTITMILSVVSIITGVFSLPGSLISILINIGILYYLTRSHIQAYYK